MYALKPNSWRQCVMNRVTVSTRLESGLPKIYRVILPHIWNTDLNGDGDFLDLLLFLFIQRYIALHAMEHC